MRKVAFGAQSYRFLVIFKLNLTNYIQSGYFCAFILDSINKPVLRNSIRTGKYALMKKHNFSAGPAILPAPVLKEAAKAVTNYEGIGLSLLELSHRGSEFTAIIEEANAA
jgi:hypothetical protein